MSQDKATLIIGGFAGSGTRGHADFLNQLSFAEIKGEICSKKVLRDIVRLVKSTKEAGENRWWQKRTLLNFYEKSLDIFGIMATKTEQSPYNHNMKIIGFKSPYCEKYHEQLNSIFWSSDNRNHFFAYSCRNVFDTCLSMKNRFNTPVEKTCRNIIKSVTDLKSLNLYENIKLHVVQLDGLIKASKEGGENALKKYYYDHFISIVSPSIPKLEFYNEASYTPDNRNRTKSKLFQALTDEEKDLIINNSTLKDSLRYIEEEFGAELQKCK